MISSVWVSTGCAARINLCSILHSAGREGPLEIGRLSGGFKDSSTIIPAPPGRRRRVLHDNYPIESIQGDPLHVSICYPSSLSIQTDTRLSVLSTHLISFCMPRTLRVNPRAGSVVECWLISRLINYSCVHGGVRKVVTFRTWPFPDE